MASSLPYQDSSHRFCYECKKQFTVKLGTIFEDSPLGLDKWMTAFWMLVNCKNGVSSCEIARSLGITQKSAWFMLQRLRLALQDDFFGKKITYAELTGKNESPRHETTGTRETRIPF